MSAAPGAAPSAARLALLARRARQEGLPALLREPIAVVGMGCRLPGGAHGPERYWELLLAGFDAVRESPAERWSIEEWYDPDPATPGRTAVKDGGFLDDAAGFDSAFFGISPREAERMDPHQRIALEVAWEALEDAGLRGADVWDAQVGVFAASYNNDYVLHQYLRPDAINERTITGVVHSIVANRISYYLGLHGPSITIDTACSSSLVSVHLAVQSLRTGGCDVALAGGVSLMLRPEPFVAMSKAGFMSPDGRCKTFDARADGFGRGEGCGFVVLKRLSDALAAGDRIDAVIRGTAVNQDGHSTVLAAPNGRAQVEVVRAALADGQVDPALVSYIEAHGTGTRLGDPIEVESLAEALGAPRGTPRLITSVKANIGHLEAAAGIAGIIKAVLCLRHRRIPPQVQFTQENPLLRLAQHRFEVPVAARDWMGADGAYFAGVSSFGVGGTNAHVVLEAPPASRPAQARPSPAGTVLLLSARTAAARDALAARYAEQLERGDDVPEAARAVASAAATRRTRFEERLAVVGTTPAELAARLRDRGTAPAGSVSIGRAEPEAQPRLVYVFSGQGSQWAGMAQQLMREQPEFLGALEEIDALFRPLAGWSLLDALHGRPVPYTIDDTACAQPLIFAIQVALARVLDAWGVRPWAVVGHSIGEIAAAVASGHLTLADAVPVVFHRGRVMQQAAADGAMLSARMSATEAESFLAGSGIDGVVVAGMNAPRSVVFSGRREAMAHVSGQLVARGVQVRDVGVRYGFHSAQMRPLESQLREALQRPAPTKPQATLFSTVTGEVLPAGGFDPAYVARNIVSPVRFHAALRAAIREGGSVFLELGPRGVLGPNLLETLEEAGRTAVVTTACTQRESGRAGLLAAIGALFCAGVEANWAHVLGAAQPDTPLPTYPWQHVRCWLEGEERGSRAGTERTSVAGVRIESPAIDGVLFERRLSPSSELLGDHVIGGTCLVPGAMMLEMARAAGESVVGGPVVLRDAEFLRPVSLSEEGRQAQVWVRAAEGGYVAELHTRATNASWALAFRCRIEAAGDGELLVQPLKQLEPALAGTVESSAFYDVAAERGCEFGAGFRRVTAIRTGTRVALATLSAEGVPIPADAIAPALLDAALQPAIALLGDAPGLFIPAIVRSFRRTRAGVPAFSVVREVEPAVRETRCFDVDVLDSAGALLARVDGLALRAAPAGYTAAEPGSALYVQRWSTVDLAPSAPGAPVTRWEILGQGSVARAMRAMLTANGAAPSGGPRGVVFCVDAPADDVDPLAHQRSVAAAVLPVVRSLSAERGDALLLVTRGSQTAGGSVAAGAAEWNASLAGVARAVRREHDGVRCAFVDLDPSGNDGVFDAARVAGSGEPVLVRRGGEWLAPRLERASTAVAAQSDTFEVLELATPGDLSSVRARAVARRAPAEDEVEIGVRWGALNFRDVLGGLGVVTTRTTGALGHECAGVVLAVGGSVTDLRVGDEVLALAEGAFGDRVTCARARVFRRPASLGWEPSATLPIAYLTAYHALVTLAGLRAGQRVLVHSGAGGVGLAAIHLARSLGAEVFATAGSTEKRAYLREVGVARVFDSRNTEFAAELLDATGGAGVDVVLNSLVGDAIAAGLTLLTRGGWFIELGKRDVRDPAAVARQYPGVRYVTFDLFDELDRDAAPHAKAFEEIVHGVESGVLPPLPFVVFPRARAVDAIRLMTRAGHTGKILLACEHAGAPRIRGDGTYLVTGGAGEVGLATTAWLVSRGARTVVLASRSEPQGRAAERIAELRAAGADVRWERVELVDEDSVRALIAKLGPGLRGIVHAAGMLADALLADLDADRFTLPFGPKVQGAVNLLRARDDAPLDFLLLYSAAGSLLDPAGQANYAAANAVVDAMAARLRASGYPATSVAWGLWQGGMAGQLSGAQVKRWHRQGLRPIDAEFAATLLDGLLASDRAMVAPVLIDWAQHFRERADADPIVSAFRSPAGRSTAAHAGAATTLRAQPPHRQQAALREFLLECVSRVLGRTDLADAGPDRPLRDLGMDSLMAVELRNLLTRELGHAFSATLAFDYPDVPALTAHIAPILFGTSVAPAKTARVPEVEQEVRTRAPAEQSTEAPDASILAMTEEEAERQLMEELRQLGAFEVEV